MQCVRALFPFNVLSMFAAVHIFALLKSVFNVNVYLAYSYSRMYHTHRDTNWPLVKNLHTLPMKGHKHFVHIYLHHTVDASGLHWSGQASTVFIFLSFFLCRVFHFLLFIPCLPSIKQIYMFKWTTYMNWRIIVYNRLKRPIHLEIIIKLLMLQYWITSTQKHHTFHPQSITFLCTFVLKYALKGYFT